MKRTRTICTTLGMVAWCLASVAAAEITQPAAPASNQAFDESVAPLLARRCLDCHNGTDLKGKLDLSRRKSALAGGESGRVIVPGRPAESLLWEYVREEEMPPRKPLSAAEKAVLKTWLAGGAAWGSDPIDRFRFTTDKRAGRDWWALQPVVQPRPPKITGAGVRNPIDAFIRARLADQGLSPSPEAGRRTLIRRLSFDLLGLPPTPEEVRAFVNDRSEDAYEKLVDRLLASPHYGERWARHWLDIVRFGESQGFERDKLREHSWPYRDWVVDALNRDLPYDEFARLQLAGDVLRPGDPAAITATGFLVAGPWDEVGQGQQSAAMKAVVRQDELEDVVSAVGQTFLGLTINCARCHDHKFDPVTQVEYYRLASALDGVRHGERTIPADAARLAEIEGRAGELSSQLAALDEPVRKKILAERKTNRPVQTPPQPLASWDFDSDLQDSTGLLHGTPHDGANVENGRLAVDGRLAYVATTPLAKDLSAKTLEAWVLLDNLTQRGGAAISVETLDGGTFDAIVFGEREPGRWMAGSNGFVRTQSFAGPPETEAHQQPVHVAMVYSADGTITGYRNGRPYGKPYKSRGPVTFAAGKARVVFGLRHAPAGGNKMLAGAIQRARLYDRALSPAEIAASAGVAGTFVSEAELADALSPQQRRRRQAMRDELNRLRAARGRLATGRVYAVTPRPPGVMHVFARGNPAAPGEVVRPGGVAAVKGVEADFQLAPSAADAQRRKKLAAWITDPGNPLFARVIANRLWHYHFGVGLVDTPSDFGFNGGRVTHPALLDWLAAELVRRRWSLKALHRTIVTSATYRQASRPRGDAARVDADNRLLWRKSPLRPEAEVIRDAVLRVSGKLNTQMGGPGYRDFTTFNRNSQFYVPIDPVGEAFNRRSLYRTWVRSGRNRLLDAFDCPDPSTKSPRRAVTTTPLQALALMNNSFVLRMADHFAGRLRDEAGEDVEQQIGRAFQLVYGRAAGRRELSTIKPFVSEHGLPALCRVLLNSSEFLYVD